MIENEIGNTIVSHILSFYKKGDTYVLNIFSSPPTFSDVPPRTLYVEMKESEVFNKEPKSGLNMSKDSWQIVYDEMTSMGFKPSPGSTPIFIEDDDDDSLS